MAIKTKVNKSLKYKKKTITQQPRPFHNINQIKTHNSFRGFKVQANNEEKV